MTDGRAATGPEQGDLPFRPRSAYVGHEVFGHGDGAVLVEPEVARDLRSAAEFASQERRIAGGLLYGRALADDEGKYLVVDGFLEAGPGENRGDQIAHDGRDSFTLSGADLRLLREDATRMYSAALEVGWWRTLAGPGEFGTADFGTQAQLVGPGGVGLLVFGSGLDWGTAYLGPDGQVPGSARSFIPVPRPTTEAPLVPAREFGLVPAAVPERGTDLAQEPGLDQEPGADPAPEPGLDQEPGADPAPEPGLDQEPGADPAPEPGLDQEPEPVAALASGSSLATRRQPVLTPAPQPSGPRVMSPVRVPSREWGAKPTNPGYVGPKTPTDVKIVVGALIVAIVVAAVIIGVLSSSLLIAVIIAVVALLLTLGVIVFSRL
jgi:hypothetical protein